MRKLVCLFIVLAGILTGTLSIAQTGKVTGTVLSPEKTPLEGVTITNKSTGKKTVTDAAGAFSIDAAPGQQLLVSYVGYAEQTVQAGSGKISINLVSTSKELEQAVVVAMDIKRNPRELGYSVQKVSGKDIQESQRDNFVTALQGRVAGLTVTPTNGAPGASAQIVLRGFNSASLNNQPLFIVDGVIVDNSTFNETSNGGSGLGLASDRPNRTGDYTNRMSDLNPSDIESVTVLKGPEATALYGSQAGGGAIVITTKKPRLNGGVRVNYDNSFRTSSLTRIPKILNNYAPGTSGVPSTNSFTYFGPALAADVPKYDNIGDFFKTGFTQAHNLSADFGKKNVGFRFSASYLDDQGVVPTTEYKRATLRLANTTKINKYIDITPTIMYSNTDNDKGIRGAGGYLLDVLAWPVTDQASKFLDATGHKRLLYATTPNSETIDNPFFNIYKNHAQDKTDRWVATLGIDIHPFEWLNVAGRFGYDTYKQNGYEFQHPESSLLTQAQGGYLDDYYLKYHGYNHTITATAHKAIGKWSGRVMVGTMWQDYERKEFAVSGSGLIDSSRTDSSNIPVAKRTRLQQNTFGLPNQSINRQIAYFGEASIAYNNMLFFSFTQRFEQTSVFIAANRHYNYPAFSFSAILTDIIPALKSTNGLNYAKLRASRASTARLMDPYMNQSVFVNNYASSSVPVYSYGYYNNNPNLIPEKQSTFEVGAEFKFLNNRIGLEGAYYNTHNTDQISQGFRASYGTGFVLNTQNATESRNQGVELSLNASPVRNKNFSWDISLNFNHMWSRVIDIPASIGKDADYYISDTWLYANTRGGFVRNKPTTLLTGYGYTRNNKGQILINPSTGLPVINTNFIPIGDRNPKFTLGALNTFRYKNFSLNFLWDLRVGGDIFNATDMYLTSIGKSPRTADRRTSRVIDGVLNDGLQNTDHPTKNNIVVTPYYISGAYYGETTGLPDEEFIQKKVNALRLRDITLSYTLPQTLIGKIKFVRSLSFFVTANDLILFTNYRGADPAVNGNTAGTAGVGGFGIDYGNIAAPVSFNFGLRAAF